MAFEFETQLALPLPDLVQRENEKMITRNAKLALCNLYGTLSLIGPDSAKKHAALTSLKDADVLISRFLKQYFEGQNTQPGGAG